MILEKPVEVLEDIYWLLLMPEGRSDREEWKLSVFMQMMLVAKEETS